MGIWHGLEESIWALTFTGIGICFAILYLAIHQRRRSGCCSGICESGNLGYVHRILAFGIPACVVYVFFMVLVDVPMYVNRYKADQSRGATYRWVSDGIVDSMSCDKVSKSMTYWAPEMPWMTGYFVGATAVSLWLTWGPRIGSDSL